MGMLSRGFFDRIKQAIPDSPVLIRLLGHRLWVGGKWREMGRLQFEFMVKQGLLPHHHLLDIGCGALRGGRWFISYLDEACYTGVDKEALLLERGRREIDRSVLEAKRPLLIVTDRFDFSEISRPPDFGISVSLFTHLTSEMIALCLRNLRDVARPETIFFASFFRSDSPVGNPERSHSHKNFLYTTSEIEAIAADSGWSASLVGSWGHPRGQEMMRFGPSDAGSSSTDPGRST